MRAHSSKHINHSIMANEIESLDSQNPVVDTVNDENEAVFTQAEVEELLKAKDEEKNRLYARLKKAESKSTDAKPALIRQPAQQAEETIWELADYIRDGYSREEVEFLKTNGGRDALKDPNSLVSLALKAKQEQKKAELAASQASDTTQYTDGSYEKLSINDLKGKTAAELAKLLPHAD